MSMKGVYQTSKKDGTVYYRSSFTYRNKHISLGSYATEKDAYDTYRDANRIVTSNLTISDYNPHRFSIKFEKYVSLINLRDHNVYFSNPIYLKRNYFEYYFDKNLCYKFDTDDLFYYASHKISKRGNHLFVADYGMQINLLSRYGIKSHAVVNRDYRFVNQDSTDFRYENLEIINQYIGVHMIHKSGTVSYKAIILIRGNYVIGSYPTPEIAAIAYNKAADYLMKSTSKKYRQNYIEGISPRQYADIYQNVELPIGILEYGTKKE